MRDEDVQGKCDEDEEKEKGRETKRKVNVLQ
jgi:hypothetical protein